MVFPIDREPSGKKREKVFSLDQYQLMRTMLPHHNNFVQVQEMKRQELHQKRKDAILKAYHNTMTIFELNKVCEENVLTGSKRSSLSDCSVLHFYNLAKKEELLSFVTVRMFKDLCDTAAKDLTTRKKGKPADFDARTELEDEIGGTVTLLEIAFKMRMKPVLATAPQTPQIPNDSVSSIPIPIVAQMNKSKNFVLDETWIKSAFKCISNFKVHDDNFLQTSLSSIELLRHDLLEKMISNRLAIHLSKYPGIKIGSQEWRFIFANIGRVSVILKLLQYVRPDATLKTTRETETLLSPSFIKDHEELAESHANQHGCFIVFDPHRGSAILVGTAPNKFGHKSLPGQSSGQYNLHEYSSKQRSSSIFYNAYPHKDLAVKVDGLHRGVFQDLEFVPVIRFEHTDRENVQSLFEWDDDVVQMLKNKKISDYKTLSDKKHLLVCYLFESTIQMCLTPIDDLAENPGCGSFSSVSNS